MKASHIHVAFRDPKAAAEWFKKILSLSPIHEAEKSAIFRFGDFDFVIDGDWGQGDTSMTFAIHSNDCKRDYEEAVRNGARPRTAPRDKGGSIGADVFGPGGIVIEFEQLKE